MAPTMASAASETGETSDTRDAEVAFTWRARRRLSTWSALCPASFEDAAPLARIEAALADDEAAAELRDDERTGTYPRRTVARLAQAGLGELLAGRTATVPSLCAMNALAARASGSLGITLGVNALALLPVYIASDEGQRREIFEAVRKGAFASLLLTELPAGSNLVAIQSFAEAGHGAGTHFVPLTGDPSDGAAGAATAYRLTGEKDLINGGSEHRLQIVLLRTRRRQAPASSPLEARGDFSLFWLDRGEVDALPRWSTLPASAADIAGARFSGVVVPASRRIGGHGDGFGTVQKTLLVSRGCIGALASGTTTAAAEMALGYALDRELYGRRIVELGPVADHLVQLLALDLAVAAVSVKSALATNAFGLGAAHYTAVAKFACCRLAEDAVTEGRRLVAARALLEEMPYARVARDVLLYGVFDGTSHLMLEQIYWRVQQLVLAEASPAAEGDPLGPVRRLYGSAARPLLEVVRLPERVRTASFTAPLEAIAAACPASAARFVAGVAREIFCVAATARAAASWSPDGGERARLAEAFASIEAAVALLELCDPQVRALLGIAPWKDPTGGAAYEVAWRHLVVTASAQTRALGAALSLHSATSLAGLEDELHGELATLRRRCRSEVVQRFAGRPS